ncbi:MAG: hypothetical protein ACXABY_10150 [Candidatus Thorarchaeota archaeon]
MKIIKATAIMAGIITMLVIASTPIMTAGVTNNDPIYDWDIQVNALTDQAWFLQGTMEQGTTFYGEITVTNEDVWFYVLDNDGYALTWNVDNAVFSLGEIIGFHEFEFQVPNDDSYYFIFGNMDALLSTTYVTGWCSYDNTAPTVSISGPTSAAIHQSITLTITASDNFGLSWYTVYNDEGGYYVTGYPLNGKTFSDTLTISFSDPGYHTVYSEFTDIRGLTTSRSINIYLSEQITNGGTTPNPGGGTPTPLYYGFAISGIAIVCIVIGVVVAK